MSVVSQAKPYTAEDLERLCAQGYRYELIRGELREMAPVGMKHANVTVRLAGYVHIFLMEHDLGESFGGEPGCVIGRDPDTVLAPDWAFIVKERLPDEIPDNFSRIVPDIVLETRSPNDTRKEVQEKVQLWLQAGVRIVWALDPKARALTVYRPDAEPRTLGIEDALSGEDVLPGFTMPMRTLFRETARKE